MAEFHCPECGESIEYKDRRQVISRAMEHAKNEHSMKVNQNDILASIKGV